MHLEVIYLWVMFFQTFLEIYKITKHNTVYNQLLVYVYSENPTDFPQVRFLLVT